jgi:hypothetical protein
LGNQFTQLHSALAWLVAVMQSFREKRRPCSPGGAESSQIFFPHVFAMIAANIVANPRRRNSARRAIPLDELRACAALLAWFAVTSTGAPRPPTLRSARARILH